MKCILILLVNLKHIKKSMSAMIKIQLYLKENQLDASHCPLQKKENMSEKIFDEMQFKWLLVSGGNLNTL